MCSKYAPVSKITDQPRPERRNRQSKLKFSDTIFIEGICHIEKEALYQYAYFVGLDQSDFN